MKSLEVDILSVGLVKLRGQGRGKPLDIITEAYFKEFRMISKCTLVGVSRGEWAQVHAKEKLEVHASSVGSEEFQEFPLSRIKA